MPNAEHVVDNFEALVFRRVVNGSDITNLSELCSGVILEEGEHGDDTRWCDADAQLVLPDGKSAVLLLKRLSNDILARTAGYILASRTSNIVHIYGELVPSLRICRLD